MADSNSGRASFNSRVEWVCEMLVWLPIVAVAVILCVCYDGGRRLLGAFRRDD